MKKMTDLDKLLESYPPAIRGLTLETQKRVLDCIPGAEEMVDAKARVIGYGFGSGYTGTVCTIILSKTGVKLGIPYGAELPDPKKLMQGSGKVHRHVQISRAEDLETPGLEPLLKACFAAWKRRNEGKKQR